MSEDNEGDGPALDKPFILGINGSPRKQGASARNLLKTMHFVDKYGGRTEIVHLVDKKIATCEGCYSNNPRDCTYPCIHNDDTRWLHKLLLEADGFILATPVYWFGPGPLTENFIAKLTALENNNYMLEGRAAGIIVSCGMHGADSVAQRLLLVFSQMGILVPPYGAVLCNIVSDIISRHEVVNKIFRKGSKIFQTEMDGSSEDFESLAKGLVGLIRQQKNRGTTYN